MGGRGTSRGSIAAAATDDGPAPLEGGASWLAAAAAAARAAVGVTSGELSASLSR